MILHVLLDLMLLIWIFFLDRQRTLMTSRLNAVEAELDMFFNGVPAEKEDVNAEDQ